MGPVHAVFKADGDETRGRYSISEWWLEPYTRGPGAHTHEEDDVFFVIEGTMSFFVGGAWIDAPKGSLVIAPGGTAHAQPLGARRLRAAHGGDRRVVPRALRRRVPHGERATQPIGQARQPTRSKERARLNTRR
jgi:Cupin domain